MVNNRNTAEANDPIEHKKLLIHEPSYDSSSSLPHPHNFVMKHTNRLKCAKMLQAEKTMKYQPGRDPVGCEA